MIELIKQGGPVIYILLALNILGLALILTKFFSMWSFKVNIRFHAEKILKKIKGLEKREGTLDLIKDEISRKMFSLERGLSFIKMIASIAPLLGLLGTVWGILSTFKIISSQGLDNPSLFAEGISYALITTVAGLVVAIPHVIGFHFLTGRLDYLENNLEERVVNQFLEEAKK